jgi:hypothetical protein
MCFSIKVVMITLPLTKALIVQLKEQMSLPTDPVMKEAKISIKLPCVGKGQRKQVFS